MTTLEQIIATVQTLPREDRRSLQLFLQEQERRDAAALPVVETSKLPDNGAQPAAAAPRTKETVEQQVERYRRAKNWIDEHRAEYLGQWVALEGDQLISHGPDAVQVHQAAKAAGSAAPFLERIVEKEEGPYWGGWL